MSNLIITDFIGLTIILFSIGFIGIFVRYNFIIMLMAIELIMLSVTILFIAFSVYLNDAIGFLAAILILTVAAAESSIGLAILVTFYRLKGGIGLNLITALKG